MPLKLFRTSAAILALIGAQAHAESHSDVTSDPDISATQETTPVDKAIIETAQELADSDPATLAARQAETDRMVNDLKAAGLTVGDVIGMSVLTANNEVVGDVDYIVDGGPGHVAIIGLGGFLGLGEYTVAVPMAEFGLTQDNELRLANWTETELELLPEIDESEVDSLPDDTLIDTSF